MTICDGGNTTKSDFDPRQSHKSGARFDGPKKAYHSRLDATGAKTGDGAANDEGNRVERGAADGRPDLEQYQSHQECRLDVDQGVHFAKDQKERAVGQQVGRAVPSDVARRGKVGGDSRDGGGDDELVLCSRVESCQPGAAESLDEYLSINGDEVG
jgi:hypothetical protein